MKQEKVLVSVFQKPKKGNAYCGDSYFYTETDELFVCAIADGLGSGEFASESSEAVIDIIAENIYASVEELVKLVNEALTGKRGVVLGILKLDFKAEAYSFSSIGNIGMIKITKDKKKSRNIPNSGYLAGYIRKIKVVNQKLEKGTNFILFSDGVEDKELSQYYFLQDDVTQITKSYEQTTSAIREDDTTLIAMRYE
ncbi:SpoIIE family protein phosphatase [Oceanobacillus sp. CAU 1775]